jgi:hypothetical protein
MTPSISTFLSLSLSSFGFFFFFLFLRLPILIDCTRDILQVIELLKATQRSEIVLRKDILQLVRRLFVAQKRARDSFRECGGFVCLVSLLVNLDFESGPRFQTAEAVKVFACVILMRCDAPSLPEGSCCAAIQAGRRLVARADSSHHDIGHRQP